MKLQPPLLILLFFSFLHCFDVKQSHFEHKANFTYSYNLPHQKINQILFTDSYSTQSSSTIWLPSKKFMVQATTKEVWHALCNAYGPDINKRHFEILKLHQYYKYPSFIEIIKSFDEYPVYIVALAKKLHKSKLKFFCMHKKIRKKIYALSDEIIANKEAEKRKIRQTQLVQRQKAVKINQIESVLKQQNIELENLLLHYQDLLQTNTLTDAQCLRYVKRIEGI